MRPPISADLPHYQSTGHQPPRRNCVIATACPNYRSSENHQELYRNGNLGCKSSSSSAEDRRYAAVHVVWRTKNHPAEFDRRAPKKYIEKIIADEQTNAIIVMANDEAMQAVVDLIKADVDVDPSSRAQIHVVYLDTQKRKMLNVLSNLAQRPKKRRRSSRHRPDEREYDWASVCWNPKSSWAKSGWDTKTGATAAFEGVRITSDEHQLFGHHRDQINLHFAPGH